MRIFGAQPVWDMMDVFEENEEEAEIRHAMRKLPNQISTYLNKVDLFNQYLRDRGIV